MSFDEENSFDVGKDGIQILDVNGDNLAYLVAGAGNPIGLPAPVNTWWFSSDSQLIYYKFGAGNADWRQVRGEDVAFDGQGGGLTSTEVGSAIREAERGTKFRITQTAHGLTLPASGILPIVYDNVSGLFQEANANSSATACDFLVVAIPDANTLEVQVNGVVNVTHGLSVGSWYVLDNASSGSVVRSDLFSLNAGEGIQFLFFTLNANQLVISVEPYFVQGDPVTPPAPINRVTNWSSGSTFSTGGSPGSDRAAFLWVAYENSGSSQPTQIELTGSGISGSATFQEVSSTFLSSGFNVYLGLFVIFEPDVSKVSGSPNISATFSGATPSDITYTYATYENVSQLLPTSIQTRQSTSGSGILSFTNLAIVNNGLSLTAWISGNVGISTTVTTFSTQVFDASGSGFAAFIYERVPTSAGFDDFELDYSSGNRQILKGVGVDPA